MFSSENTEHKPGHVALFCTSQGLPGFPEQHARVFHRGDWQMYHHESLVHEMTTFFADPKHSKNLVKGIQEFLAGYKNIPDRDIEIYQLRYGLIEETAPLPYTKLAGEYHLSTERIRQIIAKCERMARHPSRRRPLYDKVNFSPDIVRRVHTASPFTQEQIEIFALPYHNALRTSIHS